MSSSLTDVVVERDPFFLIRHPCRLCSLWYLPPPLDVPGSIYKSHTPICLDLTLGLAVNSFSHWYCDRDEPGCVGKCNRYDCCTLREDYFIPGILGVTAATTSTFSAVSPTQSRSAGTSSIQIHWPSLVALAVFSLLL